MKDIKTVFVISNWSYDDGRYIVAIHRTRKGAKETVAKLKKTLGGYESIEIVPWRLKA